MGNELLVVLDYIEREKGIERDVIVAAIESALLSAAKKRFGEEVDLQVKIDDKTGDIEVIREGEKVDSEQFGRIAAQTAKQIITQKIREAEREVVFNDYQGRVGDITNGIVHRFEKGNIIIDLGKTEGVLPHRETLPNEEFRQGSRVRALIVDVRKTNKGPQIVLSRTDPGFVRRLFELEVPEIYEGIVEIRAISRQAGERAKVAVYSKDDKIDSVGACVGVRGSRIKNIVRELHGEKVDIVRWSEDISEYARAAMSPAKIAKIEIVPEYKKLNLDVEDEFLSLAIGKRGQNVRLASKLVGWTLNINNREAAAASSEGKSKTASDLDRISGIGEKTRQLLVEAGYHQLAQVIVASVDDLTKIKGIGSKRAEQIIEEAKNQI